MNTTVYLDFDPDEGHPWLNELLAALYSYYPLGAESFARSYPGYKRLGSIVNNKIQSFVENNPDARLEKLLNKLQSLFPSKMVMDLNMHHTPNYGFMVDVNIDENPEYRKVDTLELSVSLAVDYFTVFHRERYLFKNNDNSNCRTKIMDTHVRCTTASDIRNPEYAQAAQDIIAGTAEFFPDKTYIEYERISEPIIKGMAPYGAEPHYGEYKQYSLYNYLFTN